MDEREMNVCTGHGEQTGEHREDALGGLVGVYRSVRGERQRWDTGRSQNMRKLPQSHSPLLQGALELGGPFQVAPDGHMDLSPAGKGPGLGGEGGGW